MALRCALLEFRYATAAVAVILGLFVFLGSHPIDCRESSCARAEVLSDWNQCWPAALAYEIEDDCDDGTEVNGIWYTCGYTSCLDYLGKDQSDTFTVGLRFTLPDLEQGQGVKYARLRLAAQGGEIDSRTHLVIRGVAEDSPEALSELRRPSVLPKTETAVTWNIHNPWLSPGDNLGLRYNSPNVADIVTEILSRPGWGQGVEGKSLILTIEGGGCIEGETNCLMFEDYSNDPETRDEAVLEVYLTLDDAFVGKPTLGRPTDTSVTVQVTNLLGLDIYAEYGTAPEVYSHSTPPLLGWPAGEPGELRLAGLEPDVEYFYRVRYRESGDSVYLAGMEGRFHTQRERGAGYEFTIQADSHLWPFICQDDTRGLRLYEQTVTNIGLDGPDFHISMGDFAHIEHYLQRDVLSREEAVEKYLAQREYLDKATHSIPFYLVLGNHEGEQGWRVTDPDDSVAVWGALARKRVVINPAPDGFYSGDSLVAEGCGLREAYYSWEWGDALLVVLDPFWYTETKPHSIGGGEGSEDPWDWTLGLEQYNWLYETLQASDATWKFVFIHHLVGGLLSPHGMLMAPYGRGGIEAAKQKVDGRASYEWGGENSAGTDIFATMRPGWAHGPIHDLLVNEGVTILFHGHDHVFVHQVLDGVVYQACPQPSDADYGVGWYADAYYHLGEKRNNSGHIRVKVQPDYVQVDYVRAVLPEDEPLLEDGTPIDNGEISCSYSIGVASMRTLRVEGSVPRLLGNRPNPFSGDTQISLYLTNTETVSLKIFNIEGQLIRTLFEGSMVEGANTMRWDGSADGRAPVAAGIYLCTLKAGRDTCIGKMILLR